MVMLSSSSFMLYDFKFVVMGFLMFVMLFLLYIDWSFMFELEIEEFMNFFFYLFFLLLVLMMGIVFLSFKEIWCISFDFYWIYSVGGFLIGIMVILVVFGLVLSCKVF